MKKRFLLISILVLIGCNKTVVETDFGTSNISTAKECQEAMKLAVEVFSFPGADLLAVSYDEEKLVRNLKGYEMEEESEVDNPMILLSKFYVSGSNLVLT